MGADSGDKAVITDSRNLTESSHSVDQNRSGADPKFSQFLWGLLAFTTIVVLFGAFVRASISGDGCGTNWPLCGGDSVIPIAPSLKTIIEFSHRATSGLLLLGIVAANLLARKRFEKGHAVRRVLMGSLACTLVSALIGAALVKGEWVTYDVSTARAIFMPVHLVNNYFLLAFLTLGAFWAGGGRIGSWKNQGTVASALKLTFGGMFVLGMTGAISAMGKTAFSRELEGTSGVIERLNMHVGEGAHPLLRGGVIHPIIATSVGLLLIWACSFIMQERPDAQVRKWASNSIWLFMVQFVFGVINLLMSAPVWMQISHLALAVGNFCALVMLSAYALQHAGRDVESTEEAFANESPEPRKWSEVIADYVALTKPRVISLLLFTTVAAMFIAAGGGVSIWLVIWVCIGGYMSAGAANTYNMVVERDLDLAMERTSHRPTVGNRITNRAALIFATVLAIGSFVILSLAANVLSASMALAGLLTYVFIYTLWLKRRTWQNIVIGGAAGAFPPLVGYAAVTGTLSPLAWFLFALIFVWTPVHFWALAILIKDDYAKAGVPMLPVVKGDRVTVIQITVYAVLTAIVCVVPLLTGEAGGVYVIGAGLLNLGLLVYSLRLLQDSSRQKARALFKYSMLYLALIFVVMAIDRVGAIHG